MYYLDIKRPRLCNKSMATAIDLLEKKSSNSENIKQKMLQLKQEKLEIIGEKLTVDKDIPQQLRNINSQLSFLREQLVGQYLQEEF